MEKIQSYFGRFIYLAIALVFLSTALIQLMLSPFASAIPTNGKVIAYDQQKIYSYNSDGTGQTTLHQFETATEWENGNTGVGKISPDGKRAIFSQGNEWYVANIFGENKKVFNDGPTYFTVFSNDGTKIAYVKESPVQGQPTIRDIYIFDIQTGSNTNLTDAESNNFLTIAGFTPDGTKIVFSSSLDNEASNDIKTIPVAGGTPTTIVSDSKYNVPKSISPDGTKIVYSKSGISTSSEVTPAELRLVNINGTGNTLLESHSDSMCEDPGEQSPCSILSSFGFAVFSPDGSKVAYTITHGYVNLGDSLSDPLKIVNTSGTPNPTILDAGDQSYSGAFAKAFSPDGQRVLFEKATSQSNGNFRPHSISTTGTGLVVFSSPGTLTGGTVRGEIWLPAGPTFTKGPDGTIITTIPAGTDYSSSSYTVIENETLTVDGKIGTVTIQSGGTLKGTGTVGTLIIESGGHVAPGNSPGCLTAGNTTISGSLDTEIGGTTACSGYDQLTVNGTVNVTGGTLNVSFWNGFVPKVGDSFTVLNNDGSDAVTGTFNNLAEGATFEASGVVFKISYVGGDGNDIALTVQSIPATPNTGIGILKANPLLTLLISSLCAGALFLISRRYGLISKA